MNITINLPNYINPDLNVTANHVIILATTDDSIATFLHGETNALEMAFSLKVLQEKIQTIHPEVVEAIGILNGLVDDE